MSKKLFLAGAAALSLAMAPQAAHAVTVSTTFEANGQLPGYTSATVVQNFSGANPLNTFTTSLGTTVTQTPNPSSTNFVSVVSGSGTSPLPHAQPFSGTPDFGSYLTVGPKSGSPASYTMDFSGTAVHFLSFVFGSLDQSNQIVLNLANAGAVTLTGAQILSGNSAGVTNVFTPLSGPNVVANGSTSGRVSFNFGSDALNSIQFLQTDNTFSFEIDEIALAAPEPATWAMMLLGFGLVGSQLRRRSRKPAQALAAA